MMNYNNRYPWITEALRTKIKRKNQLHAIVTSSHCDSIMKVYKEAKKVFHSTLRNSVTCITMISVAFHPRHKSLKYYGDKLELNKNY